MISNKVMKIDECPGGVFYKADCTCCSNKCITSIDLEYDKDFGDINMNFYKDIAWCSSWGNLNWFQRAWKRITACTRILFTGFIELEESFQITGVDHIDSFIEALNEGKEKLVKHKEQMAKNKEKV